jgi:hypothetical protein
VVAATGAQFFQMAAAFLDSPEKLPDLDTTVSWGVRCDLVPPVPEHAHCATVIVPLNVIKAHAELNEAL